MQPTLPQTAGTADMDLTAVHSMDWFFKKEQIYLLAQFWQQRATLAEKEVNTLKEQLSTNISATVDTCTDVENHMTDDIVTKKTIDKSDNSSLSIIEKAAVADIGEVGINSTAAATLIPPKTLVSPSINNNNINRYNYNSNNNNKDNDSNNSKHTNNKFLDSVVAAISLQNGSHLLATTPSPSPPLSDNGALSTPLHASGGTRLLNGCLNPKIFFNHAQQVMMMEAAAAAAANSTAATTRQQQQSPLLSAIPATENSNIEILSCAVKTNNNNKTDNRIGITNNNMENIADTKNMSDTETPTAIIITTTITTPTTYKSSTTSDDTTYIKSDSEEYQPKSELSSRNIDNQLIITTATTTTTTTTTETKTTTTLEKITTVAAVAATAAAKVNNKAMHTVENMQNVIEEDKYENNETNTNTIQRNCNCNCNCNCKDNSNNNSTDHLVDMASSDCIHENDAIIQLSTCKENEISNHHCRHHHHHHQQQEQQQPNLNVLLAAKDKEIRALIEEVNRLKSLEHAHIMKIRHLEENIDVKQNHIIHLETCLNKHEINITTTTMANNLIQQQDNIDINVENFIHNSNSNNNNNNNMNTDNDNDNDGDNDNENDNNNTITIRDDNDNEQQHSEQDELKHVAKPNLNDMEIEEINCDDDNREEQQHQAQQQHGIKSHNDEYDQKQSESSPLEDDECIKLSEHMNEINIKKETQSPPLNTLDCLTQQNAIAMAAAAAAAYNNDPNKFQELLVERTKAFVAAEALKKSENDALQRFSTGGMHYQHEQHQQHLHHQHQHQHHHHHHSQPTPLHLQHQHQHQQQHHLSSSNLEHSVEHNKLSRSLHDSRSSTSTPNLHDQQSNDENILPLNGLHKSLEDNNNSLSATPTNPMVTSHPHMTHNFLPNLPFQFQERGHFHFVDDMQIPPGTSMAGHLGESLIPKSDPMEAKLQEMLRYNMDKYANQALDTLHISRRVRELLSVHNIGQRIFAKYVLGLSQGTVSELLSKPKPWDKLTEKGRDSYRKMHAWSCDENAVMLLKSLIPKKDSGLSSFGGRDDIMSDERIAHILNETSSLIKTSTSSLQHQYKDAEQQRRGLEDSQNNEDSKSPLQHSPSPFFKEQVKQSHDSMLHPSNTSHVLPDEINPEKMARLYHEIMSRVPRDAFPSFMLNPFFNSTPPTASGVGVGAAGTAFASLSAEDNMRTVFEREMVKMQQQHHQQQHQHQQKQSSFPNFSNFITLQQQMLNGAQDLSVGKDIINMKDSKTITPRSSFESSPNVNSMDSINSVAPNTHNSKESTATTATTTGDRLYTVMSKSDVSGGGSHSPVPHSSSNTATIQNNSTVSSPLSNTILPPVMATTDEFATTASPLQRMASITNSLITQPPIPPHHPQPQRPTKAVLPPITQQQFDMFNNLNTEDIVRRVKEALSQYSISQRLFGESVLGLSQGSVSDLLARPKPWHMLTQKGREPFIRMKMFLEDENAVHKLVASQYKIAPEKLMRTGNYSGAPQLPQSLTNKIQGALPMQKMINDLKLQEPTQAQHIMQQMQAAAVMSAAMQQQQSQQSHHHQAAVQAVQAAAVQAAQHHQSMLLTSPGLPPQHAIPLPAAATTNSNPSNSITQTSSNINDKKSMMMPIHSPHTSNAMRSIHQHMSPTVYEMAALTQDLDTQVITTKIKEALLTNNIGQKIFGEAVLGLSQGSVSELLSKPKPWHMLSIKGREPFIRMQLWLSDANNVERLQLLKNERREASKRRRSTGPNQQDNSSDTSSNDTNDFYTSSPGPGSVGSSVSGAPPNKKQRVLFSEEQKEALRLAFALDPYPNLQTIEFLANELGLATRTITNWFHNHRMRLKQQVPHGPPGAENPIPSRENPNATPFDPVQFRILLQQRLLELHKERMGLTGNNPLPYPPYFAAAALLGRSLAGMPGATTSGPIAATESDLQALNQAFREQISGLDLSMSSLKREQRDDFDDDIDDNHLIENENDSLDGEEKTSEHKEMPHSSGNEPYYLTSGGGLNIRSNRRKPAAPQWVNPAITPPVLPHNPSDSDGLINGRNSVGGDDNYTSISNDTNVIPNKEETLNKIYHDVDGHDGGDSNLDPHSFIEPEIVIKQEKVDRECDSNEQSPSNVTTSINPVMSGAAAATTAATTTVSSNYNKSAESEENSASIARGTDEHLRMVRVHRLSGEEEHTLTSGTTWNY